MGGRLSRPTASDGLSEAQPASKIIPKAPYTKPVRRAFTSRMLIAPLAAFTMAGILFVYTRSSIRAAKLSVERKKEADGGKIDWGKEGARMRGQLGRVDSGTVKEGIVDSFKHPVGGVVKDGGENGKGK